MQIETRKSDPEIIIMAILPAIFSIIFLIILSVFGRDSNVSNAVAITPGLSFPLWILAFLKGAKIL